MQNSTDVLTSNKQILLGTTKDKFFYDRTPIPFIISQYSIEPVISWLDQTIKLKRVSVSELICKNNRFPYGRYNVRGDNPKLFSYVNGPETSDPERKGGGVKDPGNYTGGYCSQNNMSSNPKSSILFKNTNVMTKKQIYSMLSKGMRRPFR